MTFPKSVLADMHCGRIDLDGDVVQLLHPLGVFVLTSAQPGLSPRTHAKRDRVAQLGVCHDGGDFDGTSAGFRRAPAVSVVSSETHSKHPTSFAFNSATSGNVGARTPHIIIV